MINNQSIPFTERLVIGSVLLDGGIVDLTVDHFTETEHKQIWQAIINLKNNNDLIELSTVSHELYRIRLNIQPTVLAEMMNEVDIPSHKHRYAEILKENKNRIDIKNACEKSIQDIENQSDLQSVIGNILKTTQNIDIGSSGDQLCDLWDAYLDTQKNEEFVRFGHEEIDKRVEGLRRGMFAILAAYSGTGKTMIGLQMAVNFAKQGKKISFYSLEMAGTDIFERVNRILKYKNESLAEVNNWDFIVNTKARDWTSISIDAQKNSREIIFVDFAQIIAIEGRNEYEKMQSLARQIQSFAQETKTTVCLLSQISNENAKNSGGIVNAKGGGDLFAACDLFIDIRRDFEAEQEQYKSFAQPGFSGDKKIKRNIVVAKNRYGMQGGGEIYFLSSYGLGLYEGF